MKDQSLSHYDNSFLLLLQVGRNFRKILLCNQGHHVHVRGPRHPIPSSPTMATSIIQGPWLPPPASVYQNAAGTHAVGDKAAWYLEARRCKRKTGPPIVISPGLAINNSDSTIAG